MNEIEEAFKNMLLEQTINAKLYNLDSYAGQAKKYGLK